MRYLLTMSAFTGAFVMSLSAIAIQSKWQDWTSDRQISNLDTPHLVEKVIPSLPLLYLIQVERLEKLV